MQFVNDNSIIFIDKTDPYDPLKKEQHWRHTNPWRHDCTILVNYYKDWKVLGLGIWIQTRI